MTAIFETFRSFHPLLVELGVTGGYRVGWARLGFWLGCWYEDMGVEGRDGPLACTSLRCWQPGGGLGEREVLALFVVLAAGSPLAAAKVEEVSKVAGTLKMRR